MSESNGHPATNGLHTPEPPADLIGVRVQLATLGTVRTGINDATRGWWAKVGDSLVVAHVSEEEALRALHRKTAAARRERAERLRREMAARVAVGTLREARS